MLFALDRFAHLGLRYGKPRALVCGRGGNAPSCDVVGILRFACGWVDLKMACLSGKNCGIGCHLDTTIEASEKAEKPETVARGAS